MNLDQQMNDLTKNWAKKLVEFRDSSIFAFVETQFKHLQAIGEDPREYEIIFISHETPHQTVDGFKIDNTLRIRKIQRAA